MDPHDILIDKAICLKDLEVQLGPQPAKSPAFERRAIVGPWNRTLGPKRQKKQGLVNIEFWGILNITFKSLL